MLHVSVAAVGRVRENYLAEGLALYQKRLQRYVKLDMTEVADEPCPETLSPADAARVMDCEGERLLQRLPGGCQVVALERRGEAMNSLDLAAYLENSAMNGGHVAFVIGGSLGLSPAVLKRADKLLTLSAFTFPHQLTRLLLLEQLYRACKINRHEPYHK
jgi:23S rRNA (pseudouridine1915-N3)-methyltransferase